MMNEGVSERKEAPKEAPKEAHAGDWIKVEGDWINDLLHFVILWMTCFCLATLLHFITMPFDNQQERAKVDKRIYARAMRLHR